MHENDVIQNSSAEVAPFNWRRFCDARAFAVALICALAAAGWAWMVLGVATLAGPDGMPDLGPGMSVLGFDSISETLAWCVQVLGVPSHGNHGTGLAAIGIALLMWMAMTMGMMLPTAAPMVTKYSEIAETAMEGGKAVSSVLYLVAGYAAVWLGFSLVATLFQIVLFESKLLSHALTPVVPWLGAGALIIAGAYQFSNLKIACLTKCRMPFSFFFANWREHPSGVFKLGLRQGLVCLGCCWALMLVMFAVGLMNLVWMALLGILMLLEKLIAKPDFLRRATGVGLLVWGLTLAGLAVI